MPKVKVKPDDDGGHSVPELSEFFRGLRPGSTTSTSQTTATIERWLTDGAKEERSDFMDDDLRGIMYLKTVGRELGLDLYTRMGDDWMQVFISRYRQGRQEMTNALIAKILSELELAKVEAKKSETAGRERTK
jgi:hypothetical protein